MTEADVAPMKLKAASGDAYAESMLGYWYYYGAFGLPQSFADAAMWYRRAAEQGNDLAQRWLGEMYEFGEGVPQDHQEAVKWIRTAMVFSPESALTIAARYRDGSHAPRDLRKAAEWCRIGADAGDISAQNMLGELYETGAGIQDFAEAARWYRKAAEVRPVAAYYNTKVYGVPMSNLGRLYATGKGVPQDYAEAARWYQRAIESDGYSGQYGLGLLYEQGLGVPLDLKKAMELYHEVAAINEDARRRLFALYEAALPLPQDDQGVIAWYRATAEKGDTRAAVGLGLHYQFGRGVQRNWTVAYALYNLAVRSGPPQVPNFTGPAETAKNVMDVDAWNLVHDMEKPGNMLKALDEFIDHPPQRFQPPQT